jgi:hypothetical protein
MIAEREASEILLDRSHDAATLDPTQDTGNASLVPFYIAY